MKLTEKMSYLQGLVDGLEIDQTTKEGKILIKMNELMKDIVLYVDDLQTQVDELTELCDILDEDLGMVEEDFYEDENYSCGNCEGCCEEDEEEDYSDLDFDEDEFDFDDDDELYEVTCPTCGDTILLDEGMIDEGNMHCPNCNELLEFDFDDLTIEDFEETEDEE